jgi:hypothetical protein
MLPRGRAAMTDATEPDHPIEPREEAPARKVISAEKLFEGEREVFIER